MQFLARLKNLRNVVENNMSKEDDDLMQADLLLRVKALEEILINKSIITIDEYNLLKEKIINDISKIINKPIEGN